MIDHYDPEAAPNSEVWLALDEAERILLVEKYHRDARVPLPKKTRRLHAAIHTVVENQLALEDQATVRAALARLMDEGLTRHEAVHAIGSVLAGNLYDRLQAKPINKAEANARYYAALEELTAEKWRSGLGEDK